MAGLHSSATMKKSPPPKLSWLMSLLICLFYFPFHTTTPFCLAASSISSNQSLTGNQTVESNGSNFVLGFFSPGNSTNSHIGIWFKKVSTQTVVWVANRKTPILDRSSSELKLSGDGNLVLLDQSEAIIWSTNTTITSNVTTTVAELLDSGNLVLRDGSNSSNVLWQSFDHPTDTWLPGMKIGLNKVTNQNKILTSWKSSEDPAPGIYSLELDPSGSSQYFIRWNRSRIYWSSGPWNRRVFRDVPEMGHFMSNYKFNFSYVSNNKENYFIYFVYFNIITKFDISLFGQIRQQTWLDSTQQWNLFWSRPRAQCQVYSVCGTYGSCNEKSLPYCTCLKGFNESSPKNWDLNDRTGGCTRNTPLQCAGNNSGNGDQDRFYTMSNVKLPDSAQTLAAASDGECKNSCLNNCSCTAYSYGSSSCSVWYGDLLNLQQASDGASNVGTLQLRLAASELPTSRGKKAVISGTVVAGVVGILALSAVIWLLVWRHNQKEFSKLKVADGTLVPFKHRHLRRITKNFSQKLGGGGFGSVFKGTMPDSTAVAVKKLEGVGQGDKQFRTEVSTIGTVQHVNLVRLYGFCSEGTSKLLVYEYMPKGSLDVVLLRNGSLVLDWKTRYQIILGIARGLAYLHDECRDCIIHCDIKPENILVDASFNPKVADFGLAKLMGRDFSRVLTTMRGTRGYLAPEWISGMAITAKADAYSYGMMLLEIVSGRRNSEQEEEGRSVFFPTLAAIKLVQGEVIRLLDPRLEDDADLEELERVCKTAIWCIQDDEISRPSMGQVVQILEGVVDVNMPPIPRSLRNLAENPDQIIFFKDTTSQSSQATSSNSPVSQNKSTSSSTSG